MDKIRVIGGIALEGVIQISGAKNAALPLMAATLLSEETVVLKNIPHLLDITSMVNLLGQHGLESCLDGSISGGHGGKVIRFSAKHIDNFTAPYDFVRKMRASILVLGPLLGRFGKAIVSQPGGCAIGTRPIDLHLETLRQLGASIELRDGYVYADAPDGLKGAEIVLPIASVGVTENLILAAVLAVGETKIINAAREPEISDLIQCLQAMGAKISGVGTDHLQIIGVKKLHGATYEVMPDRIELGTYMIAAAITRGAIFFENTAINLVEYLVSFFKMMGIIVEEKNGGILVNAKGLDRFKAMDIKTEVYPGFPTDLQAQMMALLTLSDGASIVTETIFENRFMHVPELLRMGADIKIDGKSAIIRGVKKLKGAPVMATDLRASVSLILAALASEGETIVQRVYHLDRGYERIEQKLSACGAKIERLNVAV